MSTISYCCFQSFSGTVLDNDETATRQFSTPYIEPVLPNTTPMSRSFEETSLPTKSKYKMNK